MRAAVWVCLGCGADYDPGPWPCPHCQTSDHEGKEVDVAEVHRCQACRTAYVLPVTVCPRCHGVDIRAEEYKLPKNTVHGGASNAAADTGAPLEPAEQEDRGAAAPTKPAGAAPEPALVGAPVAKSASEEVPSSPGASSSTSPVKPTTKPANRPAARRRPARTTGSRSTSGPTGSSSANLMGGGTTGRTGSDDQTDIDEAKDEEKDEDDRA